VRLAAVLLAIGITAIVGAGCGDDDDDARGSNRGDGEPSLRIRRPEEGATVDCPVRVRVAPQGLRIMGAGAEPPEESEDGRAAKLYGFVDGEPPAVGQPVPAPDGISVVAGNRNGVRLPELAPGPHTVTVVATDGGGVVLDPLVQAAVSFTVGTCAPPPPEGEAEAPPPG
jgi:hypothetical protein